MLSKVAGEGKLASAGVALAALAASAALAAWAWRSFGPSTYVRAKVMFGKARIYQVEDDEGRPVRLLEVGGIVQSGTYLDGDYAQLVFEYLRLYDLMFCAGRDIRRVCVLGCGGYDYPEHLVAHHEGVQVDAVEIDPAITDLARRYFFLDRLIAEYDAEESGRLNLICADAMEHLRTTGAAYDAIVNDAFDAGSPPEHLTTREFARAVHERLAPGGFYLTNIVSALEGPGSRFLHEQVALLEAEFAHVQVVPCDRDVLAPQLAGPTRAAPANVLAEQDNVIVIATDGDLPRA